MRIVDLSMTVEECDSVLAALDSVADSTLALVGLGGIGTAIARRALAFDMRVRAMTDERGSRQKDR